METRHQSKTRELVLKTYLGRLELLYFTVLLQTSRSLVPQTECPLGVGVP